MDQTAATSAPWLHRMLAAIAARWWLVVLAVVAALLLALLWLRQAEYRYSAELKVYAAPSSSGSRVPSALGGLAALTGLAGASSETVSPFRYYLDGVHGPEVAARLARDEALMHTIFAAEWDPVAKAWRQPPSVAGAVRRGVTGLLGLPRYGWVPPEATRLEAYIADAVTVRQSVRTPVATLGYENADPEFAVRFLTRLHTTVDGYLREQQAARTRGNIAYLAGKLQTVTLAEQRAALVAALTEQERQAMLAYGNAPYAADPFDIATVSAVPTRPRPLPLLVGAGFAGLIIGLVLAAGWRRRAPAGAA